MSRLNPDTDVVGRFFEAADAFADRVAVAGSGHVLSYRELARLVLARAAALGARPGTVGVLTRHSPDTVITLLAALTAGGTYCPVDSSFPEPRQLELIGAAGCRWLAGAGPGFPVPPDVRAISTGIGQAVDGHRPDQPHLPVSCDGQDPAYVLFTSGSTGTPKPVLTPRLAIGVAVSSLRELFGLTAGDRVLQFASLNWDTCLEEILPTLLSGACLVFHPDAHSGSFPRLLRMIAAEQVTVLDLPTAFWHELVRYLSAESRGLPSCVRLVVIGGEPVSGPALGQWRAAGTAKIRLLNTYGCTETTLVTHAVDLHGPQAPGSAVWWDPPQQPPIGHALPHVIERVEDGELLIGGPALATGYPGQPEQTAQRFRWYSAGGGPARYFRTGDRVRRGQRGMLIHAGRLDREIKVRGIRVNPAEVEALLGSHPWVAAAAVTGEHGSGTTTLTAYLVPSTRVGAGAGSGAGDAEIAAHVRSHLRASAPSHLIPHRLRVVPELAFTQSGKLDRAATHLRYARSFREENSS
jgi:nonribosomal peptide synthetase protein VioO